ncbi:MAG: shikimate kinase [Thermomonas sp.]
MRKHSHIVMVGSMGSGKSSIGRRLASRLQRACVDLDARIEADAGMTINSIFESEGEAGFRARECHALKDALMKAEACIIATGGGAVLDERNRHAMRDAGSVVYMEVEPTEQMQRLQGDRTRPLLANGDPAQRLADLHRLREPLYRDVADVIFDTTHYSIEDAADALAALLEQTSERRA